jgi:sodium-dependent dicarboxylate transporter 2/3/5
MPKRYWKNFVLLIVFLFIGFLVSRIPIAGMQEPARRTLGVLVVAALLWISEVVPLYITSFVIVFLETIFLTSLLGGNFKIFLFPFFDSVIALFLGGLVLAYTLKKFELDEWFLFSILKRIGNTPSRVLLGLMGVTAFLSMWMSNTAATALVIGLVLVLIQKIPSDDPLVKALALGVPFAANIGGIGTPIGTPPNALAIGILREKGISISFLQWVGIGLPLVIILFFLIYFILRAGYRSKLKTVQLVEYKTSSFNPEQKIVLGVFGLTLILWLTAEFHKIPSSIVSLLPVIVFGVIGFLEEEDLGKIGWDTLILMGGGLSLGLAIERSGLSSWFVNQMSSILSSKFLLIGGMAFITIILTSFISNTSAAAILLPIATSLTTKPVGIALVVALGASIAMTLPTSTAPNAIAYGSGLIKVKDMLKIGIIIAFLSGIIIIGLGMIAVNLFFR